MRTLLLLLLFFTLGAAYDNGLARKPPLGWQTWCSAGTCGTDHCFDFQIKETAKAMVDNGMKDAGFEWIILDDCWHPSRDANGTLVPFHDFFPDGMVPVIDYVHGLGLKFGLYTSVGDKTCHGGWSPGSYGHYDADADLFASWGVDYVKMDYCGDHDSIEGHKNFSRALNNTGRPIVLELCRGPYQEQADWGYAPGIAQVWRATGDHHDDFKSTISQVRAVRKTGGSGPYGWAYGDMMMTGGQGCKDYDPHTPKHCPEQTDNEYRTEISLYSVIGSPMMVGTDIRDMTAIMNETLLNADMLRVNQDEAAAPGDPRMICGNTTEVWTRKLSDGAVAVVVPNLGDKKASMTVCFEDILPGGSAATGASGSVAVKSVWSNAESSTESGTATKAYDVDVHDSVFLILKLKPVSIDADAKVESGRSDGCTSLQSGSDAGSRIAEVTYKYVNRGTVYHTGLEFKTASGHTYALAYNSLSVPSTVPTPGNIWCQAGGMPMANVLANGDVPGGSWHSGGSHRSGSMKSLKDFMSDVKAFADGRPFYSLLACTDPTGTTSNCQLAASHLYHKLTGKYPSKGGCPMCPSVCDK